MKETGNRLTVTLWVTRTLSDKVVFDGYVYPPTFPDRELMKSTLTLKENYDSFMIYGFRWLNEKEKEKIPIIEPLKLYYSKLRTRNDNGLNAHSKFTYTHYGKARTRYALQHDQPIPRIENFDFEDGIIYRFYYYCPISRKPTKRARAAIAFNWLSGVTDEKYIRVVKTVISAKKRKRVTPTINVKDRLDNTRTYEMILYKITATLKESGFVLNPPYELKFKKHSDIPQTDNEFEPKRAHHKKLKSISYTDLMKYERRISQKWFNLLFDALNDDNPRYAISRLPTHLKRIAHKVIRYTDINPSLKADLKC